MPPEGGFALVKVVRVGSGTTPLLHCIGGCFLTQLQSTLRFCDHVTCHVTQSRDLSRGDSALARYSAARARFFSAPESAPIGGTTSENRSRTELI